MICLVLVDMVALAVVGAEWAVAADLADPEGVPAVLADGQVEWEVPVWAAIDPLPDRPVIAGDTDHTAEAWAAAAVPRR